jgi:hypothetical protein
MHQLTTQQLVDDLRRQQLAHAAQQRPARRLLALRRATHRADRAERRMHRAAREAQRLRAQLEALEHSRAVITPPPAAGGNVSPATIHERTRVHLPAYPAPDTSTASSAAGRAAGDRGRVMVLAAFADGFGLAWRFRSRLAGG